jgi:predicted transcriptional regulator of viral defense system
MHKITPDLQGLFATASEQAGYFTTAQAAIYRYTRPLLSHHAATGRFIRIRRGLYRLRDYPSSPHEDVMAAWLAAGKEMSIVSHESALELLDLSDVVPNSIHILIQRNRGGLPAIPGVTFHTLMRDLHPNEIALAAIG